MLATLIRLRRPIVVAVHAGLIVAANYAAFWLRFDGEIPPGQWANLVRLLPLLLAVRMLTFVPFRLYEGLWRYTSLWDVVNIAAAVGISSAVFVGVARGVLGLVTYPRSVFLIDPLLLVCGLTAVRLLRRVYRDLRWARGGHRVLIFGAGDAGEMLVRDMKNNPFYGYQPIGFVDDDIVKVGQRIHGVRVLGTRAALKRIIEDYRPDEAIIAMPRMSPAEVRQVVASLEHFHLPIKTLPSLSDVLSGRVTVSAVRNLSVEDLLARPAVGLPSEGARALVAGRRVLVTGAGGSIGSELCRQVAALGPSQLAMLDQYENGLFAVDLEIADRWPSIPRALVVASVTDADRIDGVMRRLRPEIVFHAAAHKHVPLMEANRCEAVKNNVVGTRTVAEAAERHGAARFVLISTDKAVNPVSVMGATKKVAERVVQHLAVRGRTLFVAVRFGNVLNSNGSVVPMFLEQIRRGGPVTVTHPEIRRFFMLIPEAVQLVLNAATLGTSGAIYTLEMGEQVNIADMARNLIRLCGFIPDEEIAVTFTGLRPGEKLYEELVGSDESATPSPVEKVQRIVATRPPDEEEFEHDLQRLESSAFRGDEHTVIAMLRQMIPTFTPMSADGLAPDRADAAAIAPAGSPR